MSDSLVQTVRTDTFEMDYAKIGSGEKPLIVIPGISIKNPLNFANSFSVPYKIFLNNYTLYFFERKKEAKPGYTLEQMADDQVEALKAIGIEKADIFGVSQGVNSSKIMYLRFLSTRDFSCVMSTLKPTTRMNRLPSILTSTMPSLRLPLLNWRTTLSSVNLLMISARSLMYASVICTTLRLTRIDVSPFSFQHLYSLSRVIAVDLPGSLSLMTKLKGRL